MTVVIALVDEKGQIHIGSDSSASDNEHIESCNIEKIFLKNGFVIGVCGSFRVLNILKYIFNPLPYTYYDWESPMEFMVLSFIPDLMKVLKRNKAILKEQLGTRTMEASIIVGFCGQLFNIDSDFQVRNTPTEKFYAIGSGSEVAKGSLITSFYNNNDYYDSLKNALLSSQEYSKSVKGPFYYLSSYQLDGVVNFF
jgi:20S proteasome alpha/beta subunit